MPESERAEDGRTGPGHYERGADYYKKLHKTIHSNYLGLFVARLQEAIEEGVIAVDWDSNSEAEPIVYVTGGELVTLLQILIPEEHPKGPFPMWEPTTAQPGSEEKIKILEERFEAGLTVRSR